MYATIWPQEARNQMIGGREAKLEKESETLVFLAICECLKFVSSLKIG